MPSDTSLFGADLKNFTLILGKHNFVRIGTNLRMCLMERLYTFGGMEEKT